MYLVQLSQLAYVSDGSCGRLQRVGKTLGSPEIFDHLVQIWRKICVKVPPGCRSPVGEVTPDQRHGWRHQIGHRPVAVDQPYRALLPDHLAPRALLSSAGRRSTILSKRTPSGRATTRRSVVGIFFAATASDRVILMTARSSRAWA